MNMMHDRGMTPRLTGVRSEKTVCRRPTMFKFSLIFIPLLWGVITASFWKRKWHHHGRRHDLL